MIAADAPHEAAAARGAGRVAVVGGGMLGMALAASLARRGKTVTIVEAAPELGGLASPWRIGDFVWDRHYHVTLYSDTHVRALLSELGLDDDVRWSTPATGFFTDGRMHSMNGLIEFLRFPPLNLIDKLRLGGTILYASRIKDSAALERVGVVEWLGKLSGQRTLEKIWRPLLRAKLGDRHEQASAAFIWAIIARLYAARRNGLGRERFGYVSGGYARLIGRMAQHLRDLGVETLLGAPVERVGPGAAGGVDVTIRGAGTRTFDGAAVTLPATQAARICDGLGAGEIERLQSKRYQGIVCASVVLDEPLGPYYITNITESWVPFSAVIDMSAVVDRSEFGGKALVYLPKYVAPGDPLFAASDDEIQASFVGALERMYPGFTPARVKAFRVSRVREVFPIPTLRYSDGVPPIATSVPGLFVANSAHIVNGTLNVNETLQLAERTLLTMESHAVR